MLPQLVIPLFESLGDANHQSFPSTILQEDIIFTDYLKQTP